MKISLVLVSEDNTYNGEVRLLAEVLGSDNTALSSVLVAGKAKNFGRSLSEENYSETWSTALTRAIEQLVHDPQFAEAMLR